MLTSPHFLYKFGASSWPWYDFEISRITTTVSSKKSTGLSPVRRHLASILLSVLACDAIHQQPAGRRALQRWIGPVAGLTLYSSGMCCSVHQESVPLTPAHWRPPWRMEGE